MVKAMARSMKRPITPTRAMDPTREIEVPSRSPVPGPRSFFRGLRLFLVGLVMAALLVPSGTFAQPEAKSPKLAAFLSILVPGTGELYAGGHKSSRFFLFTEGAFWAGWGSFKLLSRSRRSTFQSYAAAHAGVQAEGKPAFTSI